MNGLNGGMVALVGGLLWAAPALAQTANHGEVAQDLRLCLEAAPMPDDEYACLGRPAAACATAGGAAAAMEPPLEVRCAEAEADAWETLLEDAVAQRLQSYAQFDQSSPVVAGPSRADRLRAAQAAWRDFRGAECRQREAEFLGDSMAEYALAGCLMQMTGERVLDLRMMVEY